MFSNRLKELRTEHSYTQEQLAKLVNVSPKTVGAWERGTRQAPIESVMKLSELFDVSTDYLLGKSEKRHYYDLTEKDKRDVGLEVEEVLNGMTGGINFYGEPMTDEGREKLKASLEMALELSKREAKKKFTPKKYRDG